MSADSMKTINKNKSVPPVSFVNHMKPTLLQTRRHSWFGASQETPPVFKTSSKVENGIYDIQEENDDIKPETNSSWWSLQKWSKSNGETNKEGLRQRKYSSTSPKTVKFREEVFSGLQRKEKNELSSAHNNGLLEKAKTPKRRSGLGNWLVDMESKDDVFIDDSSISAAPLTKKSMNKQPSFERASQRRATVHYSSSGRPSLMDLKRQAFQNSLKTSEIKAMEQFKDVCRDFIVYRLRQRNLANRVALDRPQSKDRWLTREIIFIFNELERINKCRFSDISKQIGITLRSEEVLRKVFFELSGEIITTEIKANHQNVTDNASDLSSKKPVNGKSNPKLIGLLPSFGSRYTEITWGRLCAVLAIAGGLAIDCVQQGHADLVNYLVEYTGDFAKEEDVLSWIVNQGGWEGIREMTFESSRHASTNSCYLGKVTNIAMAFVFCTVTSVIAALVVGSITRLKQT